MSEILQVWIDDKTHDRLKRIAEYTGRDVIDLAESAVAEAALDAERRGELA